MEIRWEGQLTQQDLNRAFGLHFKPRWNWWLVAALFGGPGLLAFAGAAILAITGESSEGLPAQFVLTMLIPIGIALLIAVAPTLLARYLARRAFQANAEFHTLMHGTITPEGVHLETLHTETDIAWRGLYACRRAGDMVLLYEHRAMMQVYPRRFFASDADWAAFNDLVAQRIRPVARVVADERKQSRGLTRGVILLMVAIAIVSLVLDQLVTRVP